MLYILRFLYGVDYLLTWNCKHIANAYKRKEIEKVCIKFGYIVPVICTRIIGRLIMWNDPIVEELHKRRQEMAAKFNYDVHAMCQYYREQQKLENRVVVSRKPRLIKDLPLNKW